ncbi:MAG: hypothetical protein IPI69_13260 [Bacteroidales bacterium]|nr:hypothetical protein [Bacteroidales bacterium]
MNLDGTGLEAEAIVGDRTPSTTKLPGNIPAGFRDPDRRPTTSQRQSDGVLIKVQGYCDCRGHGEREDHTIGNISLLAEYAGEVSVVMVSDTGIFTPILESKSLSSCRSAGFIVLSKPRNRNQFFRPEI